MKELEIKNNINIEVSVKKKKQVEHQLIDNIIPFDGHKIWEINNVTLEIEPAKFSNNTFLFDGVNKKEIFVKKGFTYISALNKKNALKKFKQGENGSKKINENPLRIQF